jgi:hypothetical protein
MIAGSVENGQLTHNDIIEEAVHIRALLKDQVIVDTITNRSKNTGEGEQCEHTG